MARPYGVFDLLEDGVAAPATLILNREGELAGTHIGEDIADRVSAATIIAFLADLSGGPGTSS